MRQFLTAYPLVDGSDLILSTCGWFDLMCHIYHLVWIEIETYNSIVVLRLSWFLLNREAVALLIKLSYTIVLRIVHPIAKDRSLLLFVSSTNSFLEHLGEVCYLEDVVTKYETCRIITNEVLADSEACASPSGDGCSA